MPRYRTAYGVVVDIPTEKAARIDGLTPVDASAAPAVSPRRGRKPAAKDNPEG